MLNLGFSPHSLTHSLTHPLCPRWGIRRMPRWDHHLLVMGRFASSCDPLVLRRLEFSTPGQVTHAEQVEG